MSRAGGRRCTAGAGGRRLIRNAPNGRWPAGRATLTWQASAGGFLMNGARRHSGSFGGEPGPEPCPHEAPTEARVPLHFTLASLVISPDCEPRAASYTASSSPEPSRFCTHREHQPTHPHASQQAPSRVVRARTRTDAATPFPPHKGTAAPHAPLRSPQGRRVLRRSFPLGLGSSPWPVSGPDRYVTLTHTHTHTSVLVIRHVAWVGPVVSGTMPVRRTARVVVA